MTGGVRTIRRASILLDVQDVASAQLAGVGAAADKAAKSLNGAGAAAARAQAMFIGAGLGAAAGAVMISKIVNIGAELQTTFATVEETMNATSGQMEAMKGRVNELGREMPVTMRETAEAFKEFAFAGFTAEEAVNASQAAVELAVAGQMDMAEATKQVGQMMNAFNIEADATGQAVSSLTSVFANSAIELDELGSAMRYASASMNMLGFSATETNAALGTMADAGVRGTMAGTALNQAFSKLTSGMGPTKNALDAIGLSMDDITDKHGEMLPMVEILEKFRDRLDEAGIQGAGLQEWMNDMFGRRGARAMGPLMDNLDEFTNKLETSTLAQLKTANEQMDRMSDREMAEMEILFNTDEDVAQTRQRLDDMSDEQVLELRAEMDAEMPDEPIEQIETLRSRYEEGALSVEEMQSIYEEAFDLEGEGARVLAEQTADTSTSIDELSKALENATTQGELKEAQMDTIGGRLKWMRGTMESMVNVMFEGMAPGLRVILELMVGLMEIASANKTVLRALGAVLLTVTTILGTYVAAKMWTVFWNRIFLKSVEGMTTALVKYLWSLHSTTKATYGTATATQQLTAAVRGLLASISLWTVVGAVIIALIIAWRYNILGFGDAVSNVVDVLKEFTGELETFFEMLWAGEDPDKLVEQWLKAIDVLWSAVGGVIDDAVSYLENNGIDLGLAFLDGVYEGITNNWKLILKAIMFVLVAATIVALALPATLLYLITRLGFEIAKYIGDAIIAGMRGLKSYWKEEIASVWGDIFADINDALPDPAYWQAKTKGWVMGALRGLSGFRQKSRKKIKGWIDEVKTMANPVDWLIEKFDELIDFVENLDEMWISLDDIEASLDLDLPDKSDLPGWLQTVYRFFTDPQGLGEEHGDAFRAWVTGMLKDKLPDWIPIGGGGGGNNNGSNTGSTDDNDRGSQRSGPGDSSDDPAGRGRGGPGDDDDDGRGAQDMSTSTDEPPVEPMSFDVPTETATAPTDLYGEPSGESYHDDRTLEVTEHVEVNVTNEGEGMDDYSIRKEVRRGVEQARRDTLDDLVDFMLMGGPTGVDDGTTSGTTGDTSGDTTGDTSGGTDSTDGMPSPGDDDTQTI